MTFNAEMIVFIVYLVFMVGIGLFFFLRSKSGGDKGYFLGGRQMGPWVSALSAGASDMSAWVLMGLPASIYAAGLGQAWIAIGLGIGYAVSWLVEAPRLRRYSIAAKDSITIPQYLTNRFLSKQQFHTFSNPLRDPRERVITIAFYALVRIQEVKGGDDAARHAGSRWTRFQPWPSTTTTCSGWPHRGCARRYTSTPSASNSCPRSSH